MSTVIDTQFDGVAGDDLVIADGKAHRRRFQPSRKAILEFNNELRKNPEALNHLSFAGWELCIPEVDYKMWCELIPDLASDDNETNLRAWKKFIASEWCDPYRVRDRKK